MRSVVTPEGAFIYDRDSGICAFLPSIRSKAWVKPLYAQIALTDRCNLSCWWCYASSSPEGSNSWPLEELKALLGFLDSWGILGVAFGGGEPFTYPHLAEIAEWTWNHTGLDISVTTNGTASRRQVEAVEGHVSEVRVSIRSPGECAHLKKFLGKRFELGVNLLLFRGNTGVLKDIIEGCLSIGVKDFLITSFVATGRGASFRDMEPAEQDFADLAGLIELYMNAATFKVSSRLATNLKSHAELRLAPFECERKGRIIAVTSDKSVKLSSLSELGYPFKAPEDIHAIYKKIVDG